MLSLTLLALLSASSEPSGESIRAAEVGASTGAFSSGFFREYGWEGATFASLSGEGRWVHGRLLAEGGLYAGLPVTRGGARGGVALAARAGFSGARVAGSLGALAHYTPGPAPISLLPSANLDVRAGPVVASIGLFDRHALVPARLSAEYRGFGVGYLFPMGAEAFARFGLSSTLALEARALAFQLLNATTALATVGVVWSPGAPP